MVRSDPYAVKTTPYQPDLSGLTEKTEDVSESDFADDVSITSPGSETTSSSASYTSADSPSTIRTGPPRLLPARFSTSLDQLSGATGPISETSVTSSRCLHDLREQERLDFVAGIPAQAFEERSTQSIQFSRSETTFSNESSATVHAVTDYDTVMTGPEFLGHRGHAPWASIGSWVMPDNVPSSVRSVAKEGSKREHLLKSAGGLLKALRGRSSVNLARLKSETPSGPPTLPTLDFGREPNLHSALSSENQTFFYDETVSLGENRRLLIKTEMIRTYQHQVKTGETWMDVHVE